MDFSLKEIADIIKLTKQEQKQILKNQRKHPIIKKTKTRNNHGCS